MRRAFSRKGHWLCRRTSITLFFQLHSSCPSIALDKIFQTAMIVSSMRPAAWKGPFWKLFVVSSSLITRLSISLNTNTFHFIAPVLVNNGCLIQKDEDTESNDKSTRQIDSIILYPSKFLPQGVHSINSKPHFGVH